MLRNIEFANPGLLFFLLLVPLLALWYWYRHRNDYATIQLSSTEVFRKIRPGFRIYLFYILYALRLIAIALLIVALARPQSSSRKHNVSIEGIDIVMALDISSSMLARDFEPDRLEASKKVALQFIEGRPNDRIGLVVFSGEAFTQCPLTSDQSVIKNLFGDVKSGLIEDGTAIGDGLATAVNRIKDSKAVSKVIILLTDGVNNMGSLDPLSAAEIAKLYGIRIYTIGVGTMGYAPYPVQTPFGIRFENKEVEIDESLLVEIANSTEGKYFRATDNKKLREIYAEIDKLEKSKIDVTEFRKKYEEFLIFALIATLLIAFELIIRFTILRSNP